MPDMLRAAPMRSSRPLFVTADPELLDDLQRLAAAADTAADVSRDGAEIRRLWASAPAVLVDAEVAAELRGSFPCRRENVVVVARDADRPDLFRTAVEIGAQDVAVLPDAETWLVQMLAEAAEPVLHDALTVCVSGGRGGAGASTVAAALAMTGARRGDRVLLADADPLGGGIDLVMGVEDCAGARWPDFLDRRGRLSALALRGALPTVDELAVLAWQRGTAATIPQQAMRSVLTAARRGGGLVVVDLPRHLDDATREALGHADLALLVVPCEVRAIAAAADLSTALRRHTGQIRVVARTGRGKITPDVVAASLDLPLAGRLANEPGLAAAQETGLPPALSGRGPLARFCTGLLDELRPSPGAP